MLSHIMPQFSPLWSEDSKTEAVELPYGSPYVQPIREKYFGVPEHAWPWFGQVQLGALGGSGRQGSISDWLGHADFSVSTNF